MRCLIAILAIAWLHAVAPSGYSIDALAYAANIRDGSPLFHPHHILYQPSVLVVARLMSLLGVAQPEIIGAHAHNLAWAGIAVYVMALLIGRATARPDIGAWAALFLAATAGVGVFATQNDAYVPAVACAILMLCGLQRFTQNRTIASLLMVGGAWALATLYHQTAVLLAFPVGWFLYALSGANQGARDITLAAGTAGALTLLVYLAGFTIEGSDQSAYAFARFMVEYTYTDLPAWGHSGNLSSAGVFQTLESQVHAIINVERWSLRLLAMAGGVVVMVGSAAFLIRARDRLGIASVIGFAAFFMFNLWWLPSEPELAILPAAFCIIVFSLALPNLLSLSARHVQTAITVSIWVALTVVAGANAMASAPFQTLIKPEKLAAAQSLGGVNNQECVVLDEYVVGTAVDYFSGHPTADVRRYLIRYFRDQQPESAGLLSSAECLLIRAQWLDPDTRMMGYSGREQLNSWRRAVLSLLAKSSTQDRVAAWHLQIQDDPLLGRLLFVSRSNWTEMDGERFWEFVTREFSDL